MAEVLRHRVTIEVKPNIVLQITETEARALDAIFGYNVDVFLKVFKERMGKSYVEPHEAGVRSLHETIRGILSGPLQEVSDTRRRIGEALASKR